jgi:hypothetical protein
MTELDEIVRTEPSYEQIHRKLTKKLKKAFYTPENSPKDAFALLPPYSSTRDQFEFHVRYIIEGREYYLKEYFSEEEATEFIKKINKSYIMKNVRAR